MKICLISFDYWGYDEKITQELIKMGHQAFHIKLSDYKYHYKNTGERIINSLNKIIFQKNIKKIKTEEFILSELKNKGKQDKIIVINPERISKNCHVRIKEYSKNYIAYLYDSIDRYDNKKLIIGNSFDKVFTFDKKDTNDYNLLFLPNYIHLKKKELKTKPQYKVLSVTSIDDRYPIINSITDYFDSNKISHETIFFGKRKPYKLKKSIVFTKEKLSQSQIQEKIENSEIILDVLRENQNGLSFRIFDALALEKKIITTNNSITEYDFYNPYNILVIDVNKIEIPKDFLNTEYKKIPDTIYEKYTLNSWITNILAE
ncbi:hypothetical protein [Flavobacterium pectinovorum]|uniref:hypothetical protein n=1 Tax=Flavobacterium pectinovorum TaxID=29533 RepID=UPI001FAC1477|nr:hypothetical protein [Flavobacterium pectinovorum]MCI9844934.1 hypothetical protein [Flavobacterium pectinovorum]